MSPKPVIFLSAVTRELKSARQLVANTMTFLGYEPDWEDIFGAGEGDLLAKLRRRIDASAGVVQLVGRCYGAEPTEPDDRLGRVSYTQYEALYARQQRKRVWYLFLDDAFPADLHDPEPEGIAQLQRAYRERVRSGTDLYHPIKSRDALEASALKLRDDLARLRSGWRRWAALVVGLLLATVAGIAWVKRDLWQQRREFKETKETAIATGETARKTEEKVNVLLEAMRLLPETMARQAQAGNGEDETTRIARAYAFLEGNLKLPAGTLEKELPKFARQLLDRVDTTDIDRANALFATRQFADAEAQALKAKDKALAGAGQALQDAIYALEVAGNAALEQSQYARAAEHFRSAAALTSEERDPLEWARVQWEISLALLKNGDTGEADAFYREFIRVHQRVLGPENPFTAIMRSAMAHALDARGRFAEAETEYGESIKALGKYPGAEDPITLQNRHNLALALYAQRKYPEAEAENRAVLSLRERVLGAEHLDTLWTRNNLANTLQAQGKYAEAVKDYRAVLHARDRVLGPEHADTSSVRKNLALALYRDSKDAEAEAECRVMLAVQLRVPGAEHPDTLFTRNLLALALNDQGKHAEAEQEHRAVFAIRERVLGAEHPDTLSSRNNLALALDDQGRHAEAEKENRAVLAIRERVLGAEHPDTLKSRNNLATTLNAQRKHAEAEQELRAVLKGRENVLGPQDPDVLTACFRLAVCLGAQKKFTESLEFFLRAEAGRMKVLGPEHPDSQEAKKIREMVEASLKQ